MRLVFICSGKGCARVRGWQRLEGTCCSVLQRPEADARRRPPKPGVKLPPGSRLCSLPYFCFSPTLSPEETRRLQPIGADCLGTEAGRGGEIEENSFNLEGTWGA